jgi:hypothetical protein
MKVIFFKYHILYPLDEIDNANWCMTQNFRMILDKDGYEYLMFVPRLEIERAPAVTYEGLADYVEVPREN